DRSSFHRDVSGVAQDVELSVWIDGAIATRLTGALLWSHVGASGPVAMNASRHWLRAELERRHVAVTVSFCPGDTLERVDAKLVASGAASPRSTAQSLVAALVPASVGAALLAHLHIDAQTTLAHLPREDRRRLSRALVEWPLPITGSRGYNFAEATAGGVALDEIDPSTMESGACPGLFLAGEIVDVDDRSR